MFKLHEKPTGAQLEAFREAVLPGIPIRVARQMMADSIGMPLATYEGYVYEARGVQMSPQSWTLLRITWDALLLAQWQQQRPKTSTRVTT